MTQTVCVWAGRGHPRGCSCQAVANPLPDDQAIDEAREIVIEVTNAIDKPRAAEAKQ